MLSRIRQFFDQHLAANSDAIRDPAAAARCAAAALLLEMAHMDDAMTPLEEDAIAHAVREGFGLAPEQAEELIACAYAERQQATDYHQFTSLINAHFGAAQRADLIEQLWEVAYADRELCKHEEYLVRKVANLLHVPHSAFIAAKHRAMGDDA
jgi:uncharacterized tellurite resistance protein B-like protein